MAADRQAEGRSEAVILVAADELQARRLLQRSLKRAGYSVLVAKGGLAALKLAREKAPTLILLDIAALHPDAVELCRRIREFTRIPIIVISAGGGMQEKVRALQAGADHYLVKPFDMEQMLAWVGALLRRGFSEGTNCRSPQAGGGSIKERKPS